MVKLVAEVAVNTQRLLELTYLSEFSKMKLVNRESDTMTAIDNVHEVRYDLDGGVFLYDGKTPYAGTVKSINVRYGSDDQYELSKLSIDINKMDSYFSGDVTSLMKKIFEKKDTLFGSDEDDVLYSYDSTDKVGGKKGNDTISGGKGADTLDGNKGNDTVSGGKGSDNISGSSGNDTIKGGKGSDTINGGKGNDTLTGNSGFDTFIFDTPLDPSKNVDTITDMTPGGDAIDLDKDIFTKLPSKGVLKKNAFEIGSDPTSSSVRIVYDDSSGNLYYAPNGDGGGKTLFAILDTGLALSNTDFFVI